MPDCQNGDDLIAFHLEQQHVAAGTDADHQLPQERICHPALRQLNGASSSTVTPSPMACSALGHGEVAFGTLEQPVVKTHEILARLLREANGQSHLGSALARLVQLGLQPGQHIGRVDVSVGCLGAVTRGQPRAMKASCCCRCCTWARTECSTKLDSVSPSCNTASAASRSAGSTGAMEEMQISWQAQCVAIAMHHRKRAPVLQGFLCKPSLSLHRRPLILSSPRKRSNGALSWQLPRRLMLHTKPWVIPL